MKVKNFAILSGSYAKIDADGFSYSTPKNTDPNYVDDKKREPSVIRTDYSFSNGTVRFKFLASDSKSAISLRFLKHSISEEYLLVGHSFDIESFFIIDETVTQDRFFIKAGSLSNYDLTKPHEMKVDVSGSLIRLFMDNVLMLSANIQLKEAPFMFKISSLKDIKVFDIEVEQKRQVAFIVMQFSKEYDELYENVIKPVCGERGIDTVRADEYTTSSPIISDVIRSIRESSIVIADITPDNPNVFYEIGYAHAIEKPVILLSDRKREKLPFDVSGFRTIFYENTIAGKKKVELALRGFLNSML
jgi:hypothetical protein